MRNSYPENFRSRDQSERGGHTGGFGSARGRYQGQGYQRGSDLDEPRSQDGGGYGGQWREQPRRTQEAKTAIPARVHARSTRQKELR